MSLSLTKGGVTLGIVASFPDGTELLRTCDCGECTASDRWNRYKLLPCGCHGTIVECPCRVRDKKCNVCERVFVGTRYQARGKWWVDVYEVEDPHGANAKL